MQKKLTLSIDAELIKFAHAFSKKTNQSISGIITEYLKQLRIQELDLELSPQVADLYGIFNETQIPDKKRLRKIYHEDHC
ncbi:MAG: hypothetical protein CVV64_14900 [Candidatus Wallbacteria bacterium HGW-Wallbacteria-1]|jgi:hypothetical protein|uniref:Uncharacterized protein n=1 Tax=Candidatus Wallbacteria bacterium HGW-Wallbacteria-1 TaxID=2013854 RepID=A0A2N1PLQ9_9BACT|nr:MAG: hypothetical protein CVV64_14900 [Candidatus Wallbacteria bacterium HGW-Wallbacteria-1]